MQDYTPWLVRAAHPVTPSPCEEVMIAEEASSGEGPGRRGSPSAALPPPASAGGGAGGRGRRGRRAFRASLGPVGASGPGGGGARHTGWCGGYTASVTAAPTPGSRCQA